MSKKVLIMSIVLVAISIGIGSIAGISAQKPAPINGGFTPVSSLTDSSVSVVDEQISEAGSETEVEAEIETVSFSGKIIAGDKSKTPYIRYNKADFDQAIEEEKAIYLYYYATWCSICAAERPRIFSAFDELDLKDAVGFEVHWNDGQNTADENNIAREQGIFSQHTHVYIDKNGDVVSKSLLPSSTQEIKSKLTELAQL